MIKVEDYLAALKQLTTMSTKYCNKYPGNIGLVYADGSRSFDCWNMIKCLYNGYDVNNNAPGYKCPTLSITGDVNGEQLLNKCTERSTDFSKLNQYPAGTYLYIRTKGKEHAGVYVGDTEIDGKIYNVIECTGSWERKVIWSYVDVDGARRHWKGDRKNCAWTDFGIPSTFVDFGKVPDTSPAEKPTVPPYTLRRGMYRNSNVLNLQKCLTFIGCNVGKDYKPLEIDGDFGPNTEFAVKDFQRRSRLVKDGIYGPKTYAEMVKAIRYR